MQKTIRKKEYNTETATVVHKYISGFFGDPAGYEEILYQTPEGTYFVYGHGGNNSPYPEEDIQSIAKTKIKDWLANHQ